MGINYTIDRFYIDPNGSYFLIDFNEIFRHKNWAIEFGEIQEIIISGIFKGREFKEILFDFSKSTWIDPLPIISLIVTLHYLKNKRKIIFILPTIELAESRGTKNVWAYFVTHGFSRVLSDIKNLSIRLITNENTNIQEYLSLPDIEIKKFEIDFFQFASDQYYSNSVILPLVVEDLDKIDDFDDFIHKIIRKNKHSIALKIPKYDLEQVLHKIEVFLHEVILNVKEHAYPNTKEKIIGFYIRYRDGLLRTTLTEENKIEIQKSIGGSHGVKVGSSFGSGGEFENCRELSSHSYIPNKIGFLEIIVCDCGVGIAKTLDKYLTKDYSFRELIRDVFTIGEMRNSDAENKEKTKTGGLKLVNDLLSKDNNHHFLALYEANEVLGENIPFNNGFFKETYYNILEPIRGLNYLLRFTIEEEFTEENRKNWTDDVKISDTLKTIILKKQSENLDTKKIDFLNQIPVYDYRLKEPFILKSPDKDQKYLFLFSKPKISKNDVWNFYFGRNEYINHYIKTDLTVFIIDIPSFQHFIYEASLIANPLYANWVKKVKAIILVDKKLRFCHLERIKSDSEKIEFAYKVNIEKNATFLSHPEKLKKENFFDPGNDLSDFLTLLKFHDSRIFWGNARKNDFIQSDEIPGFYKGSIEWSENQILDYYLDFNTILTETFNIELFGILMERASFFTFNKNYEIRSFDILTKPLIQISQNSFSTDDTLLTSDYQNKENKSNISILLLGSIYVSGTTSFEILSQYRKEKIEAEVIYFFVHKNALPLDDGSLPMSLLFWARNEIIEKINPKKIDPGYKRVGRSPLIARGGYKFFRIPRYDKNNNSVYFRSPRDTYNDWQSSIDSIIKIGNYEYRDSVDLIKVDLLRALRIGFQRPNESELVKYLITHFYRTFFPDESSLVDDKKLKDLKASIKNFIYDSEKNKSFFENIEFAVYPAHLNTNYAIDKILEVFEQILKPEAFKQIKQKLFALPSIKKGKGVSPYLFSPLIIEQIQEKINTILKDNDKNKPSILLFDCTVISGVTRKEIKHLLHTLGAGHVKTFSIIDRNCLSIGSPNRDKWRSFWRLDIPRLSSKENNPIANSIKKIEDEINLYHEEVQKRILDWEKHWGIKQYYYSDLETGLPDAQSIKIDFRLPEGVEDSEFVNFKNQVRFSVNDKEQIGGINNRILLKNSNGLSIYLSEIRSMTGREDLVFSTYYQKNHKINNAAWIEIFATQLLLFRTDSASDIQYRLIDALFSTVVEIKSPETNNYTALAAITLLGQSRSNLQKLWDKVISKRSLDEIEEFNIDLHIFIAYTLSHTIHVNEEDEIKRYFSRFRISNKDLIFYKYEKLIYQFIDGVGDRKSKHEKPIGNFDITKIDEKYLTSLIKELSIFRKHIAQEIRHENLTAGYSSKQINELTSYIDYSILLVEKIVPFFSSKQSDYNTLEDDKDKLKGIMKSIQSLLKEYISNIGLVVKNINTPSQQQSPLKKYFEKLIKDNSNIKIGLVDPWPEAWKNNEVWIIFDSFIKKEIEDYLLNIEHIVGDLCINNPFIRTVDHSKALLWIRIDFTNNSKHIKIEFVNLIHKEKSDSALKELKIRFPKQANFLLEILKCKSDISISEIISTKYKYIDKNYATSYKVLSVSLSIPYII